MICLRWGHVSWVFGKDGKRSNEICRTRYCVCLISRGNHVDLVRQPPIGDAVVLHVNPPKLGDVMDSWDTDTACYNKGAF